MRRAPTFACDRTESSGPARRYSRLRAAANSTRRCNRSGSALLRSQRSAGRSPSSRNMRRRAKSGSPSSPGALPAENCRPNAPNRLLRPFSVRRLRKPRAISDLGKSRRFARTSWWRTQSCRTGLGQVRVRRVSEISLQTGNLSGNSSKPRRNQNLDALPSYWTRTIIRSAERKFPKQRNRE